MSTTLTVAAPQGAHWAFETVATKGGATEFDNQPILVWDDYDAFVAYYGQQAILDSADGTSFRVAFQAIARRGAIKNKPLDEIAGEMLKYKPGKRTGAPATAGTKVGKAAKAAVDAKPELADAVQAFLARVLAGEISNEDLAAINTMPK